MFKNIFKDFVLEKEDWNLNVSNNPLKDRKGSWRLGTLFYEHSVPGHEAYWTTMDEDRFVKEENKLYPSLKKIYMSYDHVPGHEYEFATERLGGWEHWIRLTKGFQTRAFIAQWREELEIKIKANAIKSMIKTSIEGGSPGTTASKWLAEKGYVPTRGRPSKEEKAGFLKQEDAVNKEIEDDLARVGLKIVNNK